MDKYFKILAREFLSMAFVNSHGCCGHKHKISLCITHDIVRSIQHRDNMYKKKHKMTNPHSPEFDIQKINLKTYNSILQKVSG